MTRMKHDSLERDAFFLPAARGHGLRVGGGSAEFDFRAATKIDDMLEGGGRTILAPRLQVLQGAAQGGAARKAHMRGMLGRFAHADPDVEELQMGGKWTGRSEGRFQHRFVGAAAADRDQE